MCTVGQWDVSWPSDLPGLHPSCPWDEGLPRAVHWELQQANSTHKQLIWPHIYLQVLPTQSI